jgi:hypothetical protein
MPIVSGYVACKQVGFLAEHPAVSYGLLDFSHSDVVGRHPDRFRRVDVIVKNLFPEKKDEVSLLFSRGW